MRAPIVLASILLHEGADGALAQQRAASSAGMFISTLKRPVLQTIAPDFITRKCSSRITWQLPVHGQPKMSPIAAAPMRGIT